MIGFFFTVKISPQNLYKSDNFIILCFGDSHTFGMGAPPNESYPKQLEGILNKKESLRNRIKLVNLGVPGYNSSQCLARLRSAVNIFKPRIIIALMGYNNRWNFIDSNYFKTSQSKCGYPIIFRLRSIDAVLSRSKIYKFIKIIFLNIDHSVYISRTAKFRDIDTTDKRYVQLNHPPGSEELFKKGQIYYESGDYVSAEGCFSKLEKSFPENWEPHFYMARFNMFKGNMDKGREEYMLALRYITSPRSAVYILADIELSGHPISEIVKYFRSRWVEKFGEEAVVRLIDPMPFHDIGDLVKTFIYDCSEMKKIADKNNAVFVLMTYPYYTPDKFMFPPDIYIRITNYLNIPLIDNNAFFSHYLEHYRKEELFVADGHCNAKGYGLMAKDIAAELEKNKLLPQ